MPDTDTPVLDTIAAMTAASLENSDLSAREFMLVRLAALIAVDAPATSYLANTGVAADAGITLVTTCGDVLVRRGADSRSAPRRIRHRQRGQGARLHHRSRRRAGGVRGRLRVAVRGLWMRHSLDLPEPLRASYAEGNLCLFVGAGVSRSCGLPDWLELSVRVVNRLPELPLGSQSAARRQGRPPRAIRDPPAGWRRWNRSSRSFAMRYMRLEPDVDLRSLVSASLYASSIELSEMLREIVRLEKVKRVCCYNYDDLLGRGYEENGTDYVPLFDGQPIPLESAQRLVFYPHGFLPEPGRASVGPTDAVVLSEDDYFSLYRQPYGWANFVQLTLLFNYTALFVGCSLLDPNVRRLLDIAAAARPGPSPLRHIPRGVRSERRALVPTCSRRQRAIGQGSPPRRPRRRARLGHHLRRDRRRAAKPRAN